MGSKRQIFELLIALAAIAIPIVVQVLKAARKAREEAEQRAALVRRGIESGQRGRSADPTEDEDAEDESGDVELDTQRESIAQLQVLARQAAASLAEAKTRLAQVQAAQPPHGRQRKPGVAVARAVASGQPLLAGNARSGILWSVVLGPPGGRGSI